jgi:anti-sigma factor RsiW
MSKSSTPQPTPEHLEELMSRYVLDALTPEETAEFEQYLRNDLTLIQRTNPMQEIVGLLPHSTQIKAPPELRTKIQKISQATVIAQSLPPQPRPIVQRQSQRSETMGKLLGAIGALALSDFRILLRRSKLMIFSRLSVKSTAVFGTEIEHRD